MVGFAGLEMGRVLFVCLFVCLLGSDVGRERERVCVYVFAAASSRGSSL